MIQIEIDQNTFNRLQKQANIVARNNGYGKADVFVIGDENKIIKHISYGYRKYTTGEYVPNAYRNNFGWKNTYYQSAYTKVMIKV
jgi:hypothetical protein